MIKYICFISIFGLYATAVYGALAGGRPNAYSEGNNAFAGAVNPANAVWISDRFDIGTYWVHQRSSLNNYDNNLLLPPGKTDLTYKEKNLFTNDIAIHKHIGLRLGSNAFDSSFSLAAYTMPTHVKLRTKDPIPLSGTTPIFLLNRTDVISAVFSFKLNTHHSVGFGIDYFYFSHNREGYQNADNPVRSVSPGNVTNRGTDHSNGIGCSLGWRWNINKRLKFGAAWAKKNYCGHYRKYQGYEPQHAKNNTPQTLGAGFSYTFTSRIAGRLEMIWSNLSNLPGANNNILPDGSLNLNKRGSENSPGPGLQDATYINMGMGYKCNAMLSIGTGLSHRIKLPKNSNILSHTYTLQTIYDILTLGANLKYAKHDIYLVFSYGVKNKVSGFIPVELGGGQLIGEKQMTSLSLSWGYMY